MSREKHKRTGSSKGKDRIKGSGRGARVGSKEVYRCSDRQWRRLQKALGLTSHASLEHSKGAAGVDERSSSFPGILEKRPRNGRYHPASKDDIRTLLKFLGSTCTHGIASIALVPGEPVETAAELSFGLHKGSGKIFLFDQFLADDPWILTGLAKESDQDRFRAAGAELVPVGNGLQTVIVWPDGVLKDFMLFEVMLRFVGTQLLQNEGVDCSSEDAGIRVDLFICEARKMFRAVGY